MAAVQRAQPNDLQYLLETVDRHNPETVAELRDRVRNLFNSRQMQDEQTFKLIEKLYNIRLAGGEVNHHEWLNANYHGQPNKLLSDMSMFV